MHSQTSKLLQSVLLLACTCALSTGLIAQSASSAKTGASDSPSRWDIFAGYSYLSSPGKVNGIKLNGVDAGAIGSVARYFNNYVGAEVIGDIHAKSESKQGDADYSGFSAGLIARRPGKEVTPFVHALIGMESVGEYSTFSNKWGPVITLGGGMDFATPLFNHHMSIRLFQADYQYIHENWTPLASGASARANLNAARLSSGVVFHVGTIAPPPPVTIACSASPNSVFAGDPVNVMATAGNLNPKSSTVYSWSGQGVTGKDDKAAVNTANLAPGTYAVSCGVKQGKAGKEGLKPWESAQSQASFTVKPFEPPTVSCSANPTSLKPGEKASITSTAVSPQNRPLSYSYSASAGSVSGNGSSATFNSTGAPAGTAQVTCTVSDDKGHTVSANTTVAVVPPPPPPAPAPKTSALCSTSFDKDAKRPTRVDNEAKACLDEVALTLQKSPSAKAVLVGESDAKEQAKVAKAQKAAAKNKRLKVNDPAAQRAVNSKAYLVGEKGIDAARVGVATGTATAKKVENYLVPAGASFEKDVKGTTPIDESKSKVDKRKPLGKRSAKR